MARTGDKLIALSERVARGGLIDPTKIGVAADWILRNSGVARCFSTRIREGAFSFEYDLAALHYEEDLAGRYVLSRSLSLDQASTSDIIRHYRSLQNVERRLRVLKDFLAL